MTEVQSVLLTFLQSCDVAWQPVGSGTPFFAIQRYFDNKRYEAYRVSGLVLQHEFRKSNGSTVVDEIVLDSNIDLQAQIRDFYAKRSSWVETWCEKNVVIKNRRKIRETKKIPLEMVNASVAFTVSKGIFGLEEDEDGWYRYTLSSTHLWCVRYPHKIGWTIEVLWSCLRGVAIALEKNYPGLYFGYFFHDVDSITIAYYDLEHIKKDRSGDGPIDVESYLDSNRSSSFSQALWWASGLIIFNPDNGDLSASVDRSRIFTSHVESWIEDFVSYVVSLIKLKIQTEITQKENAFALAEADLSWTRAHYNQISRA